MPDLACLLLLLVFACVVAGPVFGGGVPLAADTLSLWPPQSVDSPQAVHNVDLADSALLYLPWQQFIRSSLAAGEWPLWNPNAFAGYPFMGVPQNQLYYPPGWLLWLLPLGLAAQVGAILHLWLAGAGLYWLGRVLGASRGGSLIGGLAFACSGQIYLGLEFPFSADIYVWLPFVLAATELAWRRRSWGWTALAGLLFGVLAVAGNPQWLIYSGATLALWLVLRVALLAWRVQRGRAPRGELAGQAARALAVMAWGPLLAAVHLLPVFEFAGLSTRLGATGIPLGSDDLARTVRLLARQLHLFVPQFFGNSAPKIGNPLGVDNCWYFGLAPLALAAIAPLLRREKRVWLLTAIALAGFATAAQLPLFAELHRLPGLQAQLPQRAAYLFIFGGAALSGLGFDALLALGRRRPLAAGAVGGVLLLFGLWIASLLLERHAAAQGDLYALQTQALQQAGIIFVGLLAWIAAVAALRGDRRREGRVGLAAALVALVVFDLLAYAPDYNTYVSASALTPTSPAADLLADGAAGRIMGVDALGPIFPPNSQWLYGPLQDVRGYESLHLAAYENYWANIEPEVRGGGYFNVYVAPRSYWSKQADLLNVTHLVSSQTLTATVPAKLERVGAELADAVIYRNNAALPRAFVVANAEGLAPDALAARMAAPDFDPQAAVLLPAGAPLMTGGAGSATVTGYRNLSVDVQVDAPQGGWLVLGDVNYPGWAAEVDGRAAPVYTAYGLVRAVQLPPGAHEVHFVFRPISFIVGAAISAVALLAALLTVGLAARRGRKNSVPEVA